MAKKLACVGRTKANHFGYIIVHSSRYILFKYLGVLIYPTAFRVYNGTREFIAYFIYSLLVDVEIGEPMLEIPLLGGTSLNFMYPG